MKKYILVLATLVVASAANAQSISNLSLYTKLKSNFLGKVQQETGLSANFYKKDRFTVGGNAGYLVTYPLTDLSHRKPAYTVGATLKYRLVDDSSQLSLYTKTKYDCIHTWQQETGLVATLYKQDKVSITGNVGYVQTYPFKNTTNSYTGGIQLNYKF